MMMLMPYSSWFHGGGGWGLLWEAGTHENFKHEIKHKITWDRANIGFTFPMQKKTLSG